MTADENRPETVGDLSADADTHVEPTRTEAGDILLWTTRRRGAAHLTADPEACSRIKQAASTQRYRVGTMYDEKPLCEVCVYGGTRQDGSQGPSLRDLITTGEVEI